MRELLAENPGLPVHVQIHHAMCRSGGPADSLEAFTAIRLHTASGTCTVPEDIVAAIPASEWAQQLRAFGIGTDAASDQDVLRAAAGVCRECAIVLQIGGE